MNNIEMKFRERGVIRGGILFLRAENAIDMIEQCQIENFAILGVDGFIIKENSTQPVMEHSIDLSNKANECWDVARHFLISKKFEDLFFEVVIAD